MKTENGKPNMLKKFISGGQTGVDTIALIVAVHAKLQTGGWAANGWVTEDGTNPGLANYGLKECPIPGYPARTKFNVRDSDATVIFDHAGSIGSKKTATYCVELMKPHIVNPTPRQLVFFLIQCNVEVLNVAGTRGSLMTRDQKTETADCLAQAITYLRNIELI